jgi:hypothetical protein
MGQGTPGLTSGGRVIRFAAAFEKGAQMRALERLEAIPGALQDTAKNLGQVSEKATTFIRRHPGASLLGALAFGYVVGHAARRLA